MTQTLTTKQRFWRDHIQAAQNSGLSYAAYAKANSLNPKALYRWALTLRRKGLLGGVPSAFVQVALSPAMPKEPHSLSSVAPVIVRLPNGVALELRELSGKSLQWLASL